MNFKKAYLETPYGNIVIELSPYNKEYPGITISINDKEIALIEQHSKTGGIEFSLMAWDENEDEDEEPTIVFDYKP